MRPCAGRVSPWSPNTLSTNSNGVRACRSPRVPALVAQGDPAAAVPLELAAGAGPAELALLTPIELAVLGMPATPVELAAAAPWASSVDNGFASLSDAIESAERWDSEQAAEEPPEAARTASLPSSSDCEAESASMAPSESDKTAVLLDRLDGPGFLPRPRPRWPLAAPL